MNNEAKSSAGKKKGFWARLIEKIDKKMQDQPSSSCCSSKDRKGGGGSCCS